MVIASILLVAIFGVGLGVVRTLRSHFRLTEQAALSIVIGHLIAAWLIFLSVWIIGYRFGLPIAYLLLVTGGIWGYRVAGVDRESEPWLKVNWGYFVPGIISVLVGFLMYLTYTRYLPASADGALLSGGYTWGDIALHLTIASKTAVQTAFSWDFSLFPGNPLVYPFIPDFFVGILGRLGMSWHIAFFVVNSALLSAYCTLLYTIVQRITHSLKAGILALVLLIGSGASVGMWVYLQGVRAGTAITWRTFDYTNGDTYAMHFANIVTSHLLPQRTYLAAMGVLLSIVLLLWHNRSRSVVGIRILVLFMAAFLPFVHVHLSLVALLIVAAEYSYQWKKTKRLPVPLWIIATALTAAALQLIWQFSGAFTSNFTQPHAWWLTPEGTSPLVFWFRQLGLFWLLLPMGIWLLRKERGLYALLMVIALVLFVASNVYEFQPNLWDNMKFLSVAYTFALIPVSLALAKLMRGWWTLLGVPVLITLVGSGSLALAREVQDQFVLSTAEDLAIASIIREKTPADAVIVTSSNHNQPASMLAGRTILLGYPGWLWSYGIDTTARGDEVRAIFAAAPRFEEIMKKYHAKYVLIHQFEKTSNSFNNLYYHRNAKKIGEVGNWELYELSISLN